MKTILLADDEANLRMLVHTTLEDPDYRIVEAEDGTAALTLAQEEHPDLLILDWMMPGMSGIDVARTLRDTPETANIPIILLTAKGQEQDKEQGRAVGAHAYLVKPFSPLELLEKVQEILTQRTRGVRKEEVRCSTLEEHHASNAADTAPPRSGQCPTRVMRT